MEKPQAALHIRRCHICGTVNESENALVDQCHSCGKFFAPFFFFDEKAAMGLKEGGPIKISVASGGKYSNERHHLAKTQYPPVWGITVYW